MKIQWWNLGFVEAHQNSILRGQGFCLHEVAGKGTRPSPTVSWHVSNLKAEVSGSREETRKDCKEE